MLDFPLKIYLGLYDKAVEKAVKETVMPEDVRAEIFLFSENKNDIPENVTAVFITDKVSLLRSALALKKKNLKIVYCGHAEDAGKSLNKLEALWPAGESIGIIKKRFMILIKNLKNEFYAWFYKNALLTTVNSMSEILWYQRTDGSYVLINDMFAEIVHKSKSEICGKDYSRSEKNCAESEEIFKTHDGIKQFTTHKTPVYDMYGNVSGIIGIGHNTENFSNMNKCFSALAENLPFPAVVFSSDWKIIRMNAVFKEISGIKEEETEYFDYQNWKKENMFPVKDSVSQHSPCSEIQEYQIELECNGEMKYFLVREQKIYDSFDNISGYFLTMQDITYQKSA